MFWLDEYRGWPNGDVDAIAFAIGLAIAIVIFSLAATRRPQVRPVSQLV